MAGEMLVYKPQWRSLISKRWGLLGVFSGGVALLTAAWAFASRPPQPVPVELWLAQSVPALPPTIGPLDTLWHQARPLYLPLHAGSHGPLTAQVVELAAFYDTTTIAFRVRWSDPRPPGQQTLDATRDRLAFIWHKDDLADQRGEACGTACHVVQADEQGKIRAIVPAFVPAGQEVPLLGQSVWRDGLWSLTWSRPLRSPEARDIQFIDLSQPYRVRVKVFLDLKHKPDWLTEDTYLIFN